MKKLGLYLRHFAQMINDESTKINPTKGYIDLRSNKRYTYFEHIWLRFLWNSHVKVSVNLWNSQSEILDTIENMVTESK